MNGLELKRILGKDLKLPETVDIDLLANRVHTYYSEQRDTLEKTNIILLAAASGSLQAMVAASYQVLGHPVLLGDSILNVIGWGGPEIEANIWEEYIERGFAPDWHLPEPTGQNHAVKLSGGFIATKMFNPIRQVDDYIIDIKVANENAAHLIISGVGEPMGQQHYDLLAVLCTSILGRLNTLKTNNSMRTFSREQFLLQLLTEEPDELTLRRCAGLVKLPPEGTFSLLVVDLARFQPVSVSISTLSGSLEAASSGSPIIHQDKLILLIQHKAAQGEVRSPRNAAVESLLQENGLVGAASRYFYQLKDMRWHFDRCCQILSLIPIWPESSRPVCHYDDLEDYVVLSSLPKEFLSNQNIHPIIQTLIAANRDSKFDMIETLYVYLQCAQRFKPTCQKLCIHRNTLDYRMGRIGELTHIDWGNGTLLNALYRSIHILLYDKTIRLKP